MRIDYVRLAGLALLFFVPFLGGIHLLDWGEVNLAESAREMLLTGNYGHAQIDFKPLWESPPLFLWLQALSMKVFGVGEFAARFPNVLCGLATFLLVYHLGRRLHDRAFGWLWALAWLGSLLPHLYFRSGVVDPWFNLLVFGGLYGFIEFRWQFFTAHEASSFWRRYRFLLLGGWLTGLAMLVKGPVALLVLLLTLLLYWARYRFRNRGFFKHLVLFAGVAGSVLFAWLALESMEHGAWFATEYFSHQMPAVGQSGTASVGFWGLSALMLLVGCFPVSVFALPNLWGDHQSEDEMLDSDTLVSCKRSDLATWMQLLFWVVLILFSVLPGKNAPIASLAYFPLTYLGTLTIWRALRWHIQPRATGLLLLGLGIGIGLLQAALPVIGNHVDWLQSWLTGNEFLNAQLKVDLQWHWWQGLPGLVLVAASLLAWHYWRHARPWVAAQTIFAGGAIFTAFTFLTCAGYLDRYIQCAAIEFYESKAGENCQVKPVGFQTYAPLFYSRQRCSHEGLTRADPSCFMPANRPGQKVYLVAKIPHLDGLSGCREIYRYGGFVFLEQAQE